MQPDRPLPQQRAWMLDICKERRGQRESLEFNACGFSHGKVEIVVMLFSDLVK